MKLGHKIRSVSTESTILIPELRITSSAAYLRRTGAFQSGNVIPLGVFQLSGWNFTLWKDRYRGEETYSVMEAGSCDGVVRWAMSVGGWIAKGPECLAFAFYPVASENLFKQGVIILGCGNQI